MVNTRTDAKFPYHYLCSCGRRFSVGKREFDEQGLARIQEHMKECSNHIMMGCGSPSSPVPSNATTMEE